MKVARRSKDRLAPKALEVSLDMDEWQVGQIRRTLESVVVAPASEFVEHGRVTAWLESWGSENEHEPPRRPCEASLEQRYADALPESERRGEDYRAKVDGHPKWKGHPA